MGVINTNISSLVGLNNLRLTGMGLKTSLERLSSGLRINAGADDPSGLHIAKGMEAQIGGIRTAVQNAQDGISLIRTADGSLAETHDILMRMRDLAVRTSNMAVWTTAQQDIMSDEFNTLLNEIDRKSEAVRFNAKTLFTGAFSAGLDLQIGPDNDTFMRIAISIGDLGISALGSRQEMSVGGVSIAVSVALATGMMSTDVLTIGGGGISALASVISRVNSAIDHISEVRAALGITERRLDHIIDDLTAEDVNVSAARSRIYDADMAVEIAEFTRLQILQQSGTAILAQANAQPQSVLQLLQ